MNATNHSVVNLRIRAAGFPRIKTVDEFTLSCQPGVSRDQVALRPSDRLSVNPWNLIFRGPPGTVRTHLAIALCLMARLSAYRVLSTTTSDLVGALNEPKPVGRFDQELKRAQRYRLIIFDESGNLPFGPDAANQFFQLVSSRYRTASLILSSKRVLGEVSQSVRGPIYCGRDD